MVLNHGLLSGLCNFQPSEFMKIILIITLASVIDEFNNEYNDQPLSMN